MIIKKNKNAFSLIEVIIATSIITISVFWIYKLIWENTKIINKSQNITNTYNLFPVMEECIKYLWYDSFTKTIWREYYFQLWINLDICTNSLISTWITIDNIDYILKWEIITLPTNAIDWELSIESDWIKTITWSFLEINK